MRVVIRVRAKPWGELLRGWGFKPQSQEWRGAGASSLRGRVSSKPAPSGPAVLPVSVLGRITEFPKRVEQGPQEKQSTAAVKSQEFVRPATAPKCAGNEIEPSLHEERDAPQVCQQAEEEWKQEWERWRDSAAHADKAFEQVEELASQIDGRESTTSEVSEKRIAEEREQLVGWVREDVEQVLSERMEVARAELGQQAESAVARLAQKSDELLNRLRAQLEGELARHREQAAAEAEARSRELGERSEAILQDLGKQTWSSLTQQLGNAVEQRKEDLRHLLEATQEQVAGLRGESDRLVQTLGPLANRSEGAAADLRQLLDLLQGEMRRLTTHLTELREIEHHVGEWRTKLDGWLDSKRQEITVQISESQAEMKALVDSAVERRGEELLRQFEQQANKLVQDATERFQEETEKLVQDMGLRLQATLQTANQTLENLSEAAESIFRTLR